MDLSKMSRPAKVILFCVGTMEDLKAKGLLKGGMLGMTKEKGEEAFATLKAEGFRPTNEEIEDCVAFLLREERRMVAKKLEEN
jgi:hypothetical protein